MDKLWKAATGGKARVLPGIQQEKMWKSFHSLASNSEFILEFEAYLTPALSLSISTLFIQSLARKFFEKIALVIKKSSVKSEGSGSDCKEPEMTNIIEVLCCYQYTIYLLLY